jgi:hypothetical protein
LEELKKLRAALFLKEFKKIITEGSGLTVVNRKKNRKALIELGLTKRNRKNEILALSVEDYSRGPERDRDFGGKVFIFGIKINNEEVYIKLKISEVKGEKFAVCISFHRAEYPLIYPFKKKGD